MTQEEERDYQEAIRRNLVSRHHAQKTRNRARRSRRAEASSMNPPDQIKKLRAHVSIFSKHLRYLIQTFEVLLPMTQSEYLAPFLFWNRTRPWFPNHSSGSDAANA
jgi:hypothetical protein